MENLIFEVSEYTGYMGSTLYLVCSSWYDKLVDEQDRYLKYMYKRYDKPRNVLSLLVDISRANDVVALSNMINMPPSVIKPYIWKHLMWCIYNSDHMRMVSVLFDDKWKIFTRAMFKEQGCDQTIVDGDYPKWMKFFLSHHTIYLILRNRKCTVEQFNTVMKVLRSPELMSNYDEEYLNTLMFMFRNEIELEDLSAIMKLPQIAPNVEYLPSVDEYPYKQDTCIYLGFNHM